MATYLEIINVRIRIIKRLEEMACEVFKVGTSRELHSNLENTRSL